MEFMTRTLRFKYARDEHPEAGMFSRHAHQQYEFLYLLEGDAECIIEQRCHHLKSGELLVIPPLNYHFIKIINPIPYERIVVNFIDCHARKEVVGQLFEEPQIIDLEGAPEIRELLARFLRYSKEFDGTDREILTENLLTELIYLLVKTEKSQCFTAYHSELMEQALSYIEAHLKEIRTAEEISNALFISRAHLYAVFQESFGIPPMQYIAEKRLLFAAARIQVGEKPSVAAADCGFGDYSAFYRAYKKRFGISPSQRRR